MRGMITTKAWPWCSPPIVGAGVGSVIKSLISHLSILPLSSFIFHPSSFIFHPFSFLLSNEFIQLQPPHALLVEFLFELR